MGLILGTLRLLTLVLLGHEKTIALLLENYSKYFNDFSCWLSGKRLLSFGLLVTHLKARESKFDLAIKYVMVNQASPFIQTL